MTLLLHDLKPKMTEDLSKMSSKIKTVLVFIFILQVFFILELSYLSHNELHVDSQYTCILSDS